MCVERDATTTRRLRERKRPFVAHKVVRAAYTKDLNIRGGTTYDSKGAGYGPGVVRLKVEDRSTAYFPLALVADLEARITDWRGQVNRHRGIHLWRTEWQAKGWAAGYDGTSVEPAGLASIVRVMVRPEDVRAADGGQVAVDECTISQADWKAAGLPEKATRTRCV